MVENREQYYLMNKDEVLVEFQIEKINDSEVATEIEAYRKPIWAKNLTDFFYNRKAPLYRENISALVKQCGCTSLKGYLEFTHAVSLNDTIWVKRRDEADLEWSKVSLYRNNFDRNIAKAALTGEEFEGESDSLTPEFSTNGQFAKCWLREESGIYLIKRGSTGARNAGLEPYSEYYGSKLMGKICDSSVQNDLAMYYDKIATKSLLFTSEDYGFVPFVSMSNRRTMTDILKYFEEQGLLQAFKDMIVGDTVIMNEDRHIGNFGFIIDNNTFEIVDFAPVFDHNLSLLCYGEQEDLRDPEKYMAEMNKGHKLDTGTFLEFGKKFVTDSNKKKIEHLLDYEMEKHPKYNLQDWRLEILNRQIQKQVKGLLK